MLGSESTTLTTSNYEMEDIIRIVKSLEDSGLLVKGVQIIERKQFKMNKKTFNFFQFLVH